MKQELKSGIPEFDNAVEQFENGEINFLELTCRLWNTAYTMGKSEQLNLPQVSDTVCEHYCLHKGDDGRLHCKCGKSFVMA